MLALQSVLFCFYFLLFINILFPTRDLFSMKKLTKSSLDILLCSLSLVCCFCYDEK